MCEIFTATRGPQVSAPRSQRSSNEQDMRLTRWAPCAATRRSQHAHADQRTTLDGGRASQEFATSRAPHRDHTALEPNRAQPVVAAIRAGAPATMTLRSAKVSTGVRPPRSVVILHAVTSG